MDKERLEDGVLELCDIIARYECSLRSEYVDDPFELLCALVVDAYTGLGAGIEKSLSNMQVSALSVLLDPNGRAFIKAYIHGKFSPAYYDLQQ